MEISAALKRNPALVAPRRNGPEGFAGDGGMGGVGLKMGVLVWGDPPKGCLFLFSFPLSPTKDGCPQKQTNGGPFSGC